MSFEQIHASMSTCYVCPHCGSVTAVPNNDYYDFIAEEWVEGGYFDGSCSCGGNVFEAPATNEGTNASETTAAQDAYDQAVIEANELLNAYSAITRVMELANSEPMKALHRSLGDALWDAKDKANEAMQTLLVTETQSAGNDNRADAGNSSPDVQAELVAAFRSRLVLEHAMATAALAEAHSFLHVHEDLDKAHAAMCRALDALTSGCKGARTREARAVDAVNSLPGCGYLPA